MQILKKNSFTKFILPGIFLIFFIITVITFFVHAQYFKQTLARTFAPAPDITQTAVDTTQLNRVAELINININNATSTPVVQNTEIAPQMIATSSTPSMQTAIATSSKSTTTVKTKIQNRKP